MLILVTSNAVLGNTEEGFVQICDFDSAALCRGDMVGEVALVARESGVLAFKVVPGLLVIEGGGSEFDEREILSVVIGVALDATLAGTRLLLVSGVESAIRFQTRGDFRVALQAAKRGLARREFVAGCAVLRTVQRLVCAGQRPWRDLRIGAPGEQRRNQV